MPTEVAYQEIALWLDFYSQLLTERTREVLELHYNEDMSLSEIAEHLGITRQGVHDKIIKGVAQLSGYETRLGLAKRFLDQKKWIAHAIEELDTGHLKQARQTLVDLYDAL